MIEQQNQGNGSGKKFSVNRSFFNKVQSSLVSRANLAAVLGQQYAGNRDIYQVLGYDKTLTYEKLEARYLREHIAGRIVDAPAAATWNNPPQIIPVIEGDNKRKAEEFSKAWDKLAKRTGLFSKIERADKLSGIGEYGILLIGLRGSGAMELPTSRKFAVDDLMYFSPFSQQNADAASFVDDPTNPRFGEVEFYAVQTGKNVTNFKNFQVKTHWSRTIHFADSLLADEVFGLPRLQRVYNLFNDLAKVVGGSAEFYWRIADRGLHLDINPEMEIDSGDEAALATEVDNYVNGIERVLQTRGVTAKSLGAETADPRGPFQNIMSLISGATGIPQRVLMGSERGQLASSQDKASWNDKISERQRLYAEPRILRPLIDRMIDWEMLPDIDYDIKWPVVFPQTEEERSIIAVRISSAANNLSKAKQQGGKVISDKEYREKYLDLTDEAEIPELEKAEEEEEELKEEMKKQGIVPGMPVEKDKEETEGDENKPEDKKDDK